MNRSWNILAKHIPVFIVAVGVLPVRIEQHARLSLGRWWGNDPAEKKEIEIGDAAKRMLALQSMTVEEKEDLIMEVIRDLGTDEGTDR